MERLRTALRSTLRRKGIPLGASFFAHSEPLLRTGDTHSSHEAGQLARDSAAGAHVVHHRAKMPSLFGGCCGGRKRRGKRERKHRKSRRERRHQLAAASRTPVPQAEAVAHAVPPLAATSVASESEYHDAREAWSETGTDHSPLSSLQVSPRASVAEHPHLGEDADHEFGDAGSSYSSDSGSESGSEGSAGLAAKLVSCLSIIRASSAGEDDSVSHRPGVGHHYHHAGGRSHKLPAGCTFQRRSPEISPDAATLCWDECEASNFQIRSLDYMQTKVKQPSSKPLYRLIAMDLFGTDNKASHVCRSFQLPHTGPPVVCRPAVPGGPEVVLPQLLVMNVQLPDYPAAFWGASDGKGQSIVYYFQLREDFDPDKVDNTAALGLLQRFVANGRESDGSPTRDRLKLIVRVANLEEWARVGPLNTTEFKLLQNYNEKPVLTRPQQSFHLGPNYLEVDLDVHNYAFLARKALWSYHDRLATVVWDMGFVIQGNCPEELPEQLLGCGRIYRSDFRQFRFLSELQHSNLASGSITPSVASVTGRTTNSHEKLLSPVAAAPTAAAGPSAAAAGAGAAAVAGVAAAGVAAADHVPAAAAAAVAHNSKSPGVAVPGAATAAGAVGQQAGVGIVPASSRGGAGQGAAVAATNSTHQPPSSSGSGGESSSRASGDTSLVVSILPDSNSSSTAATGAGAGPAAAAAAVAAATAAVAGPHSSSKRPDEASSGGSSTKAGQQLAAAKS